MSLDTTVSTILPKDSQGYLGGITLQGKANRRIACKVLKVFLRFVLWELFEDL